MAEKIYEERGMQTRFYRRCMDLGLSASEILELADPMRKMTEPEKEAYAAKLLEELEKKNG